MAYYSYTIMISIIYLSYYQFIQTFAEDVNIEGSSYKLSTDTEYFIFETDYGAEDYLYDQYPGTGAVCFTDLYDYKITKPEAGDGRARWKIVKTIYGYAIKNVKTDRYLSRVCAYNMVGAQDSTYPFDREALSWKFVTEGSIYEGYDTPIVTIQSATQFKSTLGITTAKWSAYQCGSNDAVTGRANHPNAVWIVEPIGCSSPSGWAFIPVSEFSNIEGRWELLNSCTDCEEFEYEYKTGVSKSMENAVSNSWSQSLSVAVSAGFEFKGIGASTDVNTEQSKEVSNSMMHSFEQTAETTHKTTCNKDSLYQWVMSSTWNDKDFTIQGDEFACIDSPFIPKCLPNKCKPNTNCQDCY